MSLEDFAATLRALEEANDSATLLSLAQSLARRFPEDPDAQRLLIQIAAKRERLAGPARPLEGAPFAHEFDVSVDGVAYRVGFREEPPATSSTDSQSGVWYVSLAGAWTRLIFAPENRAEQDPPWTVVLEPHVRAALRAHFR